MNSSLLVPALIVVAVTAGLFVFGDSLFSGGESEKANNYSVSQTKAKAPADVAVKASASMGSEFSWDEDTTEPAQSPISKPTESFVSTKQTEEAPGELYGSDSFGTDNVSQVDKSFDSVDDFAAVEPSSRSGSNDIDDFQPDLDIQAASKQVDDDLTDFFNKQPKANDSDSSTVRSSIGNFEQSPSATTSKTADRSKLEVALASPSTSKKGVDALDRFGSAPSDFTPAPRTQLNDEMKSVVMPEPKKTEPKISDALTADASSEISGALEPMKVGNNQPSASSASKSKVSAVRKFKITNPKETALAVTLSVDGKQITLKPDQSYVIQESDGEVEVTYSRGGSFGFEKKTLRKGHYRFTVSRETGWQLIN